MLKKEIIESNIKEEVANGTMEILEQNLHSILVWDDENNKEIKFSFSEFLNEKTVRDVIYISDTIPGKWKIDADELAKYLWRVCDPWFSVENQYHIGVLQTAIHELRHLQMDTNPFLPEDTYPVEESSEEAVEAYCRDVFEDNLILENIFPNLFEKD